LELCDMKNSVSFTYLMRVNSVGFLLHDRMFLSNRIYNIQLLGM